MPTTGSNSKPCSPGTSSRSKTSKIKPCRVYNEGNDIAVDAAGNAYVIGVTSSPDFPTVHPLQPTFGGGSIANYATPTDAFVAKLNPAGSALLYSTYLGGGGDDVGYGIAVDGSGNAYVTGRTGSSDFPTENPYQTYQGVGDVFVTKLSSSGN
ncbi:MAG: SBBP repeat-containing protein, partial [Chloroflexales bacterium]